MKHFLKWTSAGLAVAALLGLAACTQVPKPEPQTVNFDKDKERDQGKVWKIRLNLKDSDLHVIDDSSGCSYFVAASESCFISKADVTLKDKPMIRWFLKSADHSEEFAGAKQVCSVKKISRKQNDDDDTDVNENKWCKVIAGCPTGTGKQKGPDGHLYCSYKYSITANGMTHDPDVLIDDGVQPPPDSQPADKQSQKSK